MKGTLDIKYYVIIEHNDLILTQQKKKKKHYCIVAQLSLETTTKLHQLWLFTKTQQELAQISQVLPV